MILNMHILLQISNGFKPVSFVLFLYYLWKQRGLWPLENAGPLIKADQTRWIDINHVQFSGKK